MKFIIPAQFQAGGRVIQVRLVHPDLMPDLCGAFSDHRSTIFINENLSEEERLDTFFHEYEHCMRYALGLPDTEANHAECDARAGLMIQFFNSHKGRLAD